MAKIGPQENGLELMPIFRSYLKRKDQEIRETAALAMGISGDPKALPILEGLLRDTRQGRIDLQRSEVGDRTRAFAAQFGAALAGSDLVFVVPIYPAREQPIPGVTAKLVATAAIESIGGARVQVAASLDEAVDTLTAELSPGDVLLTLGAGDVDRVGRQVLDRLRRSHVDA